MSLDRDLISESLGCDFISSQSYASKLQFRYLIVRNVPALGCGDELLKLFSTYGEVEE
ncbi:unnamed protein product [Ilex paraguariensis]|uniref:RRM domain-containing protein n=1 Tax=Ilex paraguariensis TaxID=185542 RepID=A0ABC8SH35_9AQUA